ncbi:hypothetical protein RhiirC2_792991 [Rhizophagus irregularis]|uniref:Uncharacterized protein n=1 Tax=Rhizophagus irregularis TaxID=588596 RepID=A0A2N1MG94_9GLOM|nr:hypothetical protein RhiirC2_792991 [Rhizophagus irregularis]
MSDDEIDTEIEEGYDEFIKEYGSRYEWDNEGNSGFIPEWKGWDDLFCEIKIYWNTKAVRHWKEKALKQFVHSLPNNCHIIRINFDGKYGRRVLRNPDVDCLFKWINTRCIAKNDYYRELVEMLIQAEKESVTGIITGFKDYISQSGIANLNGVQYLLRGIHWITNPIASKGSPEQ